MIYNDKCVLISIECLLGRSLRHNRKSISFWKFFLFNWYKFITYVKKKKIEKNVFGGNSELYFLMLECSFFLILKVKRSIY